MNKPKLIRDAIYAAIQAKTGLPNDQILKSPRHALPVESLPAIAIYGTTDRILSPDGEPQDRIYTVAVDITTVGRIEDDATAVLAQQVRAAITDDDSFGGLAMRTVWASQEWGGSEQQTKPISGTLLTFDVYYRSQETSS